MRYGKLNASSQKLDIETKEPKLISLVLLILSIYSFFGYMLPKNISYGLLAVSAIVMIYSLIKKKNLKFSTKQLILASIIILFIANQLLMAPYSMFAESSIKTAINRSVILIIGVFILFQVIGTKLGPNFYLSFHALTLSLPWHLTYCPPFLMVLYCLLFHERLV